MSTTTRETKADLVARLADNDRVMRSAASRIRELTEALTAERQRVRELEATVESLKAGYAPQPARQGEPAKRSQKPFMLMRATKAGVCKETGMAINVGDLIAWGRFYGACHAGASPVAPDSLRMSDDLKAELRSIGSAVGEQYYAPQPLPTQRRGRARRS